MNPDVVVVGGGLAGITAALALADAGRSVTLVEARPRLGGSAFSFTRGPLSIDNGQHVFLRCCTAYRGLLDRLGASDLVHLQPRLDVAVLGPRGLRSRLTRTPGVPAPGHLAAALIRFRLLSPADRVRAVRGALALRTLDPADTSLDARTLGDYLREHGQNDATIAALWGVLATATLNIDPDAASLQLAAKVFRTGLLDHADGGDVGYARVPLGDIHHGAAIRALRAAGVDVRTATRVELLEMAGALSASDPAARPVLRVRGRDEVAELSPASAVLALPHHRLAALLSADGGALAADAGLTRIESIGTSPILNVHVLYDRRVTDLPFAAAIDSPVQWVFDRTRSSGFAVMRPGGQYLAVTVSAADAVISTPTATLRERYVAALADLFPAARGAQVVDAFVTRERQATFRQEAGVGAYRPPAATGLSSVVVAGAWTDTGWPDTMESAVLSGTSAAHRLLLGSTSAVGRAA
jgi:squalene-associated FAD-dependent desaturase